ncbi:MAG: DUF202 domain-containing protein [Candidatus Sulfobium sp.]
MLKKKFQRLLSKGLLTEDELDRIVEASVSSGKYPEELLLEKGVPRHEVLFCLSEYYDCPFAEYDEGLMAPYLVTMRLQLEKHRRELWFPLAVREDSAEVVAYNPGAAEVIEDIRNTLGVEEVNFRVALPADITRIVENNFDVNPGFPFGGGRTPLALVRVFLAYRRSTFAHYRTLFAKGRTGLAFVRTGLAFIAISLTFLRVFGTGLWSVLEVPFILAGLVMIFDGTRWYIPSRAVGRNPMDNSSTEPTGGTSMLTVSIEKGHPVFRRTGIVEGAEKLRAGWDCLSPVMRRRFIACDRSDFAEERTALAGHRTVLAKARTGLAFTRTGIAFAGIGIGLIRHFHASGWTIFDLALIAAGVLMSAEGFYWYFGGRRAGIESFRAVRRMNMKESIWDFVIPLRHKRTGPRKGSACPPVLASHLPGIWATTGLALERTVLAERRCVMARLRTIMARARTGLAFIRTGISITAVGAGLMVFFGTSAAGWTIFNTVLIVGGITLVADGFYWAVPAENIRAQYPYCYGDMEITVPDYGRPARRWGKAVFSHDDI